MLSTAMLQKPGFQIFDVHGIQSSYTPYNMFGKYPGSASLPLQCSDNLGGAFLILLDLGFKKQHVQPFLDLADFSMTLAAYHYGTLTNPNISEIASNRNVVHHQLLSLPKMSDLDEAMEIEEENLKLYEACRLTALLFAVMVTFPIPRSNQVRETLLRNLKDTVISMEFPEDTTIIGVQLWCLVLGGIASLGKPELPWYVEQTRVIATILGLREWSQVEGKLSTFAWLKAACRPGAVGFWSLVKDHKADAT